ncbi:PH domain-containing protein [Flavobacterium sp.]|uniref:PH domain-containing protein n=1 Tax=Flavobacterium sp. TaxID=239 RepID=UPI0026042D52|nr:PH domain-containing protein [Flavobacterium sp.]
MENFTNNKLDTKQLPRFEAVELTKLHRFYWKVVLINTLIVMIIVGIVLGVASYNLEEWIDYQMEISTGYVAFTALLVFFLRLGFRKKAFAFREHDVIYRRGVIATNTIVIPYNRVQHVSLHEGFVSRMFGLAKVEIFTAGGGSSDIEIPGIEKVEAENIKQLLMGKIQKNL